MKTLMPVKGKLKLRVPRFQFKMSETLKIPDTDTKKDEL